MYIAPRQGQTTTWGQNFYFYISLLSLWSFASSIKWLSNSFSPYKSIRDQIWPCSKTGQCQPRTIIWTNYDGPESPVLHTKPQSHWPFGSEDFWRVYYIWAWRPSWSCDPEPENKLSFPHPTKAPYEILPSGFGEEDLWKWWTTDDGRRRMDGRTDGRRTMAIL